MEKSNYAGFWIRLLAALIDWLCWITFLLLLMIIISGSEGLAPLLGNMLNSLIIFIFGLLIWPFINSYLISRFGGTLGKLITGITIVDENNKYLPFWRAFFRGNIGYGVSTMLFWLGFIWIFIDEKRQSWHDMFVGSYVMYRQKSRVIVGIIALALMATIAFILIGNIRSKFVRNGSFYQGIYKDIIMEIERFNKGDEAPELEFDESVEITGKLT